MLLQTPTFCGADDDDGDDDNDLLRLPGYRAVMCAVPH